MVHELPTSRTLVSTWASSTTDKLLSQMVWAGRRESGTILKQICENWDVRKDSGKIREKSGKSSENFFSPEFFFSRKTKGSQKLRLRRKREKFVFDTSERWRPDYFSGNIFPSGLGIMDRVRTLWASRPGSNPARLKRVFFPFSLHLVVTKTHKVNVTYSLTLVAQTMTMTSPKLTH